MTVITPATPRFPTQPQLLITTLTNGFSLSQGGPRFGWSLDGQPAATVDDLLARVRQWAEAASAAQGG